MRKYLGIITFLFGLFAFFSGFYLHCNLVFIVWLVALISIILGIYSLSQKTTGRGFCIAGIVLACLAYPITFAYFNAVQCSRYMPDRCDFGSESLICSDYVLNADGLMKIEVFNTINETVHISISHIENCNGDKEFTIPSNDKMVLTFTCQGIIEGEKSKIWIDYTLFRGDVKIGDYSADILATVQ